MSMTVEEKLNKDASWMLSELQAEMLVSAKDEVNFYYITEENAPSHREQERVLSWLHKLGAVDLVNDIHSTDFFANVMTPFVSAPTIGQKVRVDQQVFGALRKIYSGDWEKEPATEILKKAEKLRKAKKLDTTVPAKISMSKVPFWNKETSEVIFLEKNCQIPAGNQRVLCVALFGRTVGTWLEEEDVIGNFNRDGKQSFYDAQRLLNARIKKNLGITDLLEYQGNQVRINPETLKKLNHSET